MKIILREKVVNLGSIGAVVNVRAGYGRNYLIPYGLALQATPQNLATCEALRAEWEQKEDEKLVASQKRAEQLQQAVVQIEAKASEEGRLFGSVTARDIVAAAEKLSLTLAKSEIKLPEGPIRALGEYAVTVVLHGEVRATVKVVVVHA